MRTTAALVMSLLFGARVALAAPPLCGDVDDSGDLTAVDALKVLQGAVGLSVELQCVCVSFCGNGLLESGEECEGTNLANQTCETLGATGGPLTCSAGCLFDTSGCSYEERFDDSGETIIDHDTGLEWEKKDGNDYAYNWDDAHDVDNYYRYSAQNTTPVLADGTIFSDFLPSLNDGPSNCYSGHCDWRLPTIEELKSITILYPFCENAPCVLDAVFLPSTSYCYITSSEALGFREGIHLLDGRVHPYSPASDCSVRAVRSLP